jgi:hypothetical protein
MTSIALILKLTCVWLILFWLVMKIPEGGYSSDLYHKHMMIVNYASSIINKLEALLTDNAIVIIYDLRVFIVQATGQLF